MARSRKNRSSGGRTDRDLEPARSAPVRAAVAAPAAPVEESPLLSGAPTSPLNREILAWILLGFFALFVLGFWLLRIPGSEQHNPETFDRAVFKSLSTVSLTGFRQHVEGPFTSAYPRLVPLTLLILTLGGGYLTLLATALPVCRILAMPYSLSRIASSAAIVILGGTFVGMCILLLGDLNTPKGGLAALDAALKAASAIGNSGVYWGEPPRNAAATTQLGLIPLAILGGLGLPVLLDIYDRITGRTPALSYHTRLVLSLTAGVYVCGVVGLLITDSRFTTLFRTELGTFFKDPDRRRELTGYFISASTLCIESRSAAFATAAGLPRATNFVLMLLMAIGASPAGTAGGLKLTTFHVLWRGVKQGFRGERLQPMVGFAIAWTAIFLTVIFVGYATLLWFAPDVSAEHLLTIAVSATSNAGFSRDELSLVSTPLFTLCLLMALGRLLPILLLWRMAERIEFSDTVVA